MSSTLFCHRTHVITRRTHFYWRRTHYIRMNTLTKIMNTASKKGVLHFFCLEFIMTTAELIISWWIRTHVKWIRPDFRWVLRLCDEYVSFLAKKKGYLFHFTIKQVNNTTIAPYSYFLLPYCSNIQQFCTLDYEFCTFLVYDLHKYRFEPYGYT